MTESTQISDSRIGIVIVAGGKGVRCGLDVPKQYVMLGHRTVLQHAYDRLCKAFPHGHFVVVIHSSHRELLADNARLHEHTQVVVGGETRQESVHAGLKALMNKDVQYVLVHDAARPYVSKNVCKRLMKKLPEAEAVIPVLPVADTLKQVVKHKVARSVDRTELFGVQTPQAFHFERLLRLHQRAADDGLPPATDDAMLCERAGIEVKTVTGAVRSFKITTHEDLKFARNYELSMRDTRSGSGYDVHPLIPHPDTRSEKEKIIRLGGLDIPHTHYLKGHSDADAVLHAVTDAILAVAGAGDIGQHFPPSDDRYEGMDSRYFLEEAYKIMQEKGGILNFVDVTIIGEKPKISPYREQMRQHIAGILLLHEQMVNIKATTTEKLGFEGREEGLAVQAIATASFPKLY